MTRSAVDDSFGLEEVVDLPEEKPSLTEIYRKSLGQEISLDYFLFTCLEEDRTLKSLPAQFQEQINEKRWPLVRPYFESLAFLEEGAEKPSSQEVVDGDLVNLIRRLCVWYQEKYPLLSSKQPLDYEVHGNTMNQFVLLTQDFEALVNAKTGKKPHDRQKADQSEEEKAVWQSIDDALKQSFEQYGHFVLSYLEWIYKRAKGVEYDLASLPPVGRFTIMLQKAARMKGQKSEAANRSNEGRRDSKSFNGSEKSGSKPGFKDQKPGAKGSSAEKEEEAVAEAKTAIEKFEKDENLGELRLKPRNSYLRRLQHQLIVDAGYESSSVGEGSDRGVQISRKKN
ncbi:MAG: R3H domain-containing nucleic acid-binding protein [Oligoflexales bacterium]